jgi:hypothetical protein
MPEAKGTGGPFSLTALVQVLDAGLTRLSTRSDDRRPKSAKARNRGKWGTGGAAGVWRFNRAVRDLSAG